MKGSDLEIDWNKPIDFLYVDTSHTYAQTTQELKKFEPLVKSGGIITSHDIFMDEINNSITDYFKNRNDISYLRYFNNNELGIIIKNIL